MESDFMLAKISRTIKVENNNNNAHISMEHIQWQQRSKRLSV